jgi:hypothetical protein
VQPRQSARREFLPLKSSETKKLNFRAKKLEMLIKVVFGIPGIATKGHRYPPGRCPFLRQTTLQFYLWYYKEEA